MLKQIYKCSWLTQPHVEHSEIGQPMIVSNLEGVPHFLCQLLNDINRWCLSTQVQLFGTHSWWDTKIQLYSNKWKFYHVWRKILKWCTWTDPKLPFDRVFTPTVHSYSQSVTLRVLLLQLTSRTVQIKMMKKKKSTTIQGHRPEETSFRH